MGNAVTAYQRILDALRAQGRDVREDRPGRHALIQCPLPGHPNDDQHPSLSVTWIEGGIMLWCHCSGNQTYKAIADWLGWPAGKVLHDDSSGEMIYPYSDGRRVHRWYDKEGRKRFAQRGTTNGQRTVLYHLERIEEARAKGEPVILVGSEKDVLALESIGAYATCAPQGEGNFGKVDPTPLYGLEVIAIAHNDAKGEKWAQDVRDTLEAETRLGFLKPAIDIEKADAADHIAAGYSLAALVPWVPPERDGADQADEEWIAEPWRRGPLGADVLTVQDEAFDLTRAVEREAFRMKVRDLARQKLIQESAVGITLPEFIRLDDFLAQPDSATPYLVDKTWPKGGHILFAAQQKAGKTTARNNLVKSLADGYDFLDKFQITRPEGAVVILDLELPEDMLRRWMRDIGIHHQQQLVVVPMRGKGVTLNLGLPEVRARWVARLREWGASVVILDCLRPVLDALRLSEDKDASRFLGDFDAMLVEADVPDAMVIHHMGHGQERARGDSGILGWADAIWTLVLKYPQDPASPRYFRAYGRIERDIPESMLDYNDLTRRLTLVGGTRADGDADAAKPHVVAYLRAHPPTKETPAPSQTAIQKALKDDLGIPVKVTKRAIEGLVRKRVVDVRPGKTGTATAHHLTNLADEEYPPPQKRLMTDSPIPDRFSTDSHRSGRRPIHRFTATSSGIGNRSADEGVDRSDPIHF